ncbi:MAG TPA: NfeD family protein [Planctomycetaceae bacterium]|nr:NfeD family protein [Planctomycetaceae bacterium]
MNVRAGMQCTLCGLAAALAWLALPAFAQNAAVERAPLAAFLRVTGTLDEVQFGRVTNAALELQNEAVQQDRRALLVLEVTPGASQLHQVQGLADFLTSAEIARVTTVAWVPEDVIGSNALIALACKEIIMHPDARLGDVGRGKSLDPAQQQMVVDRVRKRYNPRLSPALIKGLMDLDTEVLRVVVRARPGDDATEVQVVTPAEAAQRREQGIELLAVDTLKNVGETWSPSGGEARARDVLVVQTATSRGVIEQLYSLPAGALREDPAAGAAPRVMLIRIEQAIDPPLEQFVRRQIDRALAAGANVLVVEIDSYGGHLVPSFNIANALADLQEHNVRTIAYVPQKAISGAAIIALGCDEIYMHPGAQFGDAAPLKLEEGRAVERAPEKVISLMRSMLTTLAERKGRPPALVVSIADHTLEVWRVRHRDKDFVTYMSQDEIDAQGGEWKQNEDAGIWIKQQLVPETAKGNVLTVNGLRAHDLKLAQPPVNNLDELKQRLGIPGQDLTAIGPTWVDSLIDWLNTDEALGILITVGMICLFVELHVMSGVLGIISALCFVLFFWSRVMGGTAGWLEVLLFLLGTALIVLEVFVIPGFGVFGVFGGLLVLASLVLAGQTFTGLPSEDVRHLTRTMTTVSLSIAAVVAIAVVLNRYLPHMPMFNRMMLGPAASASHSEAGLRLRPDLAGLGDQHPLLGQVGQTVSALRPAGKVQIGDEFVDVVSEGPFIDAGRRVEIVKITGNRVVVREA